MHGQVDEVDKARAGYKSSPQEEHLAHLSSSGLVTIANSSTCSSRPIGVFHPNPIAWSRSAWPASLARIEAGEGRFHCSISGLLSSLAWSLDFA